jgi:DNA-binding MarR family transcriptional regulator
MVCIPHTVISIWGQIHMERVSSSSGSDRFGVGRAFEASALGVRNARLRHRAEYSCSPARHMSRRPGDHSFLVDRARSGTAEGAVVTRRDDAGGDWLDPGAGPSLDHLPYNLSIAPAPRTSASESVIIDDVRPSTGTLDPKYQLDPVLDFMRLLWSIEHSLQRMSKRMEGELGITGPQRLVLRVVGQFPGLSAGEVAHIVRLHPSTMTGILHRLVAGGLLERARDPQDGRRSRLHLTPQAMAYTRTAPGTVERSVRLALDRVGATNVQAARTVLAEVARRLEQG